MKPHISAVKKYAVICIVTGIATSSLYSCTKCKCRTLHNMTATVIHYSRGEDSFAKVEVYVKGTGFASLNNVMPHVAIDTLYDGKGRLDYTFDLVHDYIITLYPAGKVYKVKDITLKDNSETQFALLASCKTCYDRITYSLDGVIVSHWVDTYASFGLD